MRPDWQTEKLGDVCDIYQPKTISTKEMVPDGAYPVFGANGIIGRYNQYNHEDSELLITCRGATCGSVNISTPKAWITGNAMVVRPKTGALDRTYLEYFFRGPVNLSGVITGSAQPQITRQSLAPVKITFPKPEEQKRIVAILDEAFAGIDQAIANTEKNLASARELFDSTLNTIFTQKGEGWEEKRFEEVINDTLIGLVKNSSKQGENLSFPYVKMHNISNDGRFNSNKLAYVDATKEEIEKYNLADGDFLFNTRNSVELVGKNCLYETVSVGPVLFNNNIMRIRFKPKILSSFMSFAFKCKLVKDNLETIKNGTTNVSAIYQRSLNSLLLPVAPYDQQKLVVSKLKDISSETQNLEKIYEQKLTALNELKQSLLQKAFSGELMTNESNLAEVAA